MYSKSLILSSDSSASGSKVQARADAPAWVTVDDADPRIQYSSGWQAPTDVGGLLDGTRHGATNAGLTASFRFTGTRVMAAGSMGSWDVQGVPTSQYDIDYRTVGTFTAPIIEPGYRIVNRTYFTSDDLPPGEHQLTITNVNGTNPNVFWLDYIAYLPVVSQSASPAPPSTASSTPTSSVRSTPSPASKPAALSTPPSPSASSTPSAFSTPAASSSPSEVSSSSDSSAYSNSESFSSTPSASSPSSALSPFASGGQQSDTTSAKPSHTAAIVGGVIGAVALIGLAAILALICRKRRQRAASANSSYGDEDPHGWRHGGEGSALMSPPSNMASVSPFPTTATGAFGVMRDGGHSGVVWAPSPYMQTTPTPTAAPAFTGPPASVRDQSVHGQNQSVRDDVFSPTSAYMASSVSSGPSALASTRSGPESTAATSEVASTAASAQPSGSVRPPSSASGLRPLPKSVEARMSHEDQPGSQAVDSGIRIAGEEVLPPPYTRD